MQYVKTNWINRKTPINQTNLNKIEAAIFTLANDAIEHNEDLQALKNSITEITYSEKYNTLQFKIDDTDYEVSIPVDSMTVKQIMKRHVSIQANKINTLAFTDDEMSNIDSIAVTNYPLTGMDVSIPCIYFTKALNFAKLDGSGVPQVTFQSNGFKFFTDKYRSHIEMFFVKDSTTNKWVYSSVSSVDYVTSSALRSGWSFQSDYSGTDKLSLCHNDGDNSAEMAAIQFKTINNQSIFGSGNINASADHYVNEQAPTDTGTKIWIQLDGQSVETVQEESNSVERIQYDNI